MQTTEQLNGELDSINIELVTKSARAISIRSMANLDVTTEIDQRKARHHAAHWQREDLCSDEFDATAWSQFVSELEKQLPDLDRRTGELRSQIASVRMEAGLPVYI